MRGTIFKRAKNTWRLQYYAGNKRVSETIHGNKEDAERRLTELLRDIDKGIITPPGRLTVAEHLRNWLSGYVKTNCSRRTFEDYRVIVEKSLIPSLGHIQLRKLHQQTIQRYYSEARERPLSQRTLHHHHRVLSQALKHAVRQGLIGRNPCDLTDPPKPEKRKFERIARIEIDSLLGQARDNYYYPVIYTAISSGLRQGELLGLRWRDIDLLGSTIAVSQVLYKRGGILEFNRPKTENSRATLDITPNLASFLTEYRLERESLYKQLGKILSLDDLVFTNIELQPVDPAVLSHNFKRIARKAGLDNLRFHDLRHLFASVLIDLEISPKIISALMRHSSVAFTMDTYGHLFKGKEKEAMVQLNGALPDYQRTKNRTIDNITLSNN